MKVPEYKKYRKKALQDMRPYVLGEDLTHVSVSENDTPEEGGMIARGADDGALGGDMHLVRLRGGLGCYRGNQLFSIKMK
jgi:hypothetical protein